MKKIKISKELKIGVFTIIILTTGYWGINFLKGIDVLSSNSTYYAYYEQSDNIEVSAPILLRGIKIGTVTEIGIENVNSKVKIVMSVKKKYAIPINSIAVLTDKSFMGGKAISITVGDSQTMLKGSDVMDSSIQNELKDQIDEAKSMLDNIVVKLTTTLDNVNTLLDDENIASITSTLSNVSNMSKSLDQMINVERVKIANITTNLSSITSDFQNSMPTLANTLINLESITSSINKADLGKTISSANTSIESLNKTLYDINNGSGTIGLLMNDSAL